MLLRRHPAQPAPSRTVAGLEVDYRPRRDRRQKRIRLRLAPGKVLVSFPAGWPRRLVDQFIDQHRDWIAARAQPAPNYVSGQTLARGWQLEIHPGCRRRIAGGRLIVDDDRAKIEAGIKALLKQLALAEIAPRAQALAGASGLGRPAGWRFVYLSSCWGNCRPGAEDGGGLISLNTALIHLPPRMVDLVIIHELCHLKLGRPGHGPDFWQLFESQLPEARRLSRQLNRTWRPGLLPPDPAAGPGSGLDPAPAAG